MLPKRHSTLLILATLSLATLVFILLLYYKSRQAWLAHEQRPLVLFETRLDPPYLRPMFTATSARQFFLDAPVSHARLASEVLHLTLRSDAGRQAVGFEVAITNVQLDWLRGHTYRNFSPECQLLLGPLPELTQRFIERTMHLHDLHHPTAATAQGQGVQAYPITSVNCDPAEDKLRVVAELPDGQTN